ncbi:MAG: HAD family phosphatase [Bacteroidota bacterium]
MNQKKIIKNIIFDFGGVIINIDFWRSINAFIALGAKNFDELYSKTAQTKIFDDLDTGNITPEKFCEEIKKILPHQVTKQDIIDAWNAIIIGIPEHHIRLLEKLRKNYRIFLLSNTNLLHYNVYTAELEKNYGYKNLSQLFDKVYLSHEAKLRKPNIDFYKRVLRENQLWPEETVFIDDSEQNLPPARELGIKTILLYNTTDISKLFVDGKLIPIPDDSNLLEKSHVFSINDDFELNTN